MSESTTTTAPVPGKITGAGAPVAGKFSESAIPNEGAGASQGNNAGAAAAPGNNEGNQGGGAAVGHGEPAKLPELTDEQLKEVLAGKGIVFEGDFEAMKSKLTAPAQSPQLTDEEKKAQEAAFEKRMLDFHISQGGTAEQFVALKQVAAMDLRELSVAQIKKTMKENGFNDDQVDVLLKERFYQLNPDELEKQEDEDDETFFRRKELLKKKVAYGSKELDNHGLPIKQNATQVLEDLRKAIEAEDAKNKREAEFSSKVEEFSRKYSRKKTIELGELNTKKLDPVQFEFSEADVTEVTDILKDPAKRKQYFFNQDNTLNIELVFENLLLKKSLNSLVKAGYIEGGNRQVEELKKVFPGSPYALGVGGAPQNNTGTPGKIVKAGTPVVVPNNK
jgi:hypothetical protein